MTDRVIRVLSPEQQVAKGYTPEEQKLYAEMIAMLEQMGQMGMADQKDQEEQQTALPPKPEEEQKPVEADAKPTEAENEEEQPMADEKKPVQPEEGKEDEKKEDVKKDTSSETDKGVNALASAEEHIEDLPEEDKKELAEVAKKWLAAKRAAKAAPAASVDSEVLKEFKTISAKVEQQGNVLADLLEAMKVVKAVTPDKATAPESSLKRPVGNSDTDAIANAVAKALLALDKEGKSSNPGDNQVEVRKNLRGVMSSLFDNGNYNG
jgi:hypothetical protein